jgi:hypothetical protein
MFENMMKFEKAWSEFCKWRNINSCSCLSKLNILAIMPFFFNEKGIVVTIENQGLYLAFVINMDVYHGSKSFKEISIKAYEKAFEIYNEQLNEK